MKLQSPVDMRNNVKPLRECTLRCMCAPMGAFSLMHVTTKTGLYSTFMGRILIIQRSALRHQNEITIIETLFFELLKVRLCFNIAF